LKTRGREKQIIKKNRKVFFNSSVFLLNICPASAYR